MIYGLLAHVTIGSISQYSLVGLIGLAAGLSITILNNPSEPVQDSDEQTKLEE